MCGRFTQATDAAIIAKVFDLSAKPVLSRRYNIAPTQYVAAVRMGGAGRELVNLLWGLIPSLATSAGAGSSMINARAETIAEKLAFRSAFRARRCLIVADGFYEWQKTGKTKQPYCFEVNEGELFAFAGIWDRRKNASGNAVETCSILTTAPNAVTAVVHDRMPVILDPYSYDLWLDPGMKDVGSVSELLKPCNAKIMRSYPVSTRVNQVINDDAECSARVGLVQTQNQLLF
jgi:putative SOS response-associated peptidase YedK